MRVTLGSARAKHELLTSPWPRARSPAPPRARKNAPPRARAPRLRASGTRSRLFGRESCVTACAAPVGTREGSPQNCSSRRPALRKRVGNGLQLDQLLTRSLDRAPAPCGFVRLIAGSPGGGDSCIGAGLPQRNSQLAMSCQSVARSARTVRGGHLSHAPRAHPHPCCATRSRCRGRVECGREVVPAASTSPTRSHYAAPVASYFARRGVVSERPRMPPALDECGQSRSAE